MLRACAASRRGGRVVAEKEISGGEAATTNNRMELMAAIRSLEVLKKPSEVVVYTDSRYVMDGVTRWLPRWRSVRTRAAPG